MVYQKFSGSFTHRIDDHPLTLLVIINWKSKDLSIMFYWSYWRLSTDCIPVPQLSTYRIFYDLLILLALMYWSSKQWNHWHSKWSTDLNRDGLLIILRTYRLSRIIHRSHVRYPKKSPGIHTSLSFVVFAIIHWSCSRSFTNCVRDHSLIMVIIIH